MFTIELNRPKIAQSKVVFLHNSQSLASFRVNVIATSTSFNEFQKAYQVFCQISSQAVS